VTSGPGLCPDDDFRIQAHCIATCARIFAHLRCHHSTIEINSVHHLRTTLCASEAPHPLTYLAILFISYLIGVVFVVRVLVFGGVCVGDEFSSKSRYICDQLHKSDILTESPQTIDAVSDQKTASSGIARRGAGMNLIGRIEVVGRPEPCERAIVIPIVRTLNLAHGCARFNLETCDLVFLGCRIHQYMWQKRGAVVPLC
jgi:hypothetical protein